MKIKFQNSIRRLSFLCCLPHIIIAWINSWLASFDIYLNGMCNIFQPENAFSINELKDAFNSLKTNKSPGHDDISSNIIKRFGTLNRSLHYIYKISLQSGVFPEKMKITSVTTTLIKETIVWFLFYVAFLKFLKKLCIIVFTKIYLITYFKRNNLDFKKIIQLIPQLFN